MRKSLHTILFTLFGFVLMGQTEKVRFEVGPEVSVKKSYFKEFLQVKDGFVYVFSTSNIVPVKNETYTLRKFNIATLELEDEWSAESFDYGKGDAKYRQSLVNENGFHILFDCYDRKADMKYILHRRMDHIGNFSPVKVLSAIRTKKEDKVKFFIKHSRDSTKTMIYSSIEEGGENKITSLLVFDKDFNELWRRPAMLSGSEDTITNITSTALSNNGEVFLLGYPRARTKYSFEKDKITPKYKIYKLYENDEVKEYDISRFGKYIHNSTIEADLNDKLVFMGFYSNDLSRNVKGNIFLALNPKTLEAEVEQFQEFDKEFLSQFDFEGPDALIGIIEEGMIGKDDPIGFEKFYFNDFIELPGEGFIVLMEQKFNRAHTGYGYSYTELFCGDIIAAKIDTRGALQWMTRIPKLQRGGERRISYGLSVGKDVIYLIFNDHKDDVTRYHNGEEPKGYNGNLASLGAVSRVALSKDGNFKYRQLLRKEDSDFYFLSDAYIVADPSTFITVSLHVFHMNLKKLEFLR